jgi:hypothetical protein
VTLKRVDGNWSQAQLTLICWSCVLMHSALLAWSGPATGNDPMYWNKINKQFIILMKQYSVVNKSTPLNSEPQSTLQTPCKLDYMTSWLHQYTMQPLQLLHGQTNTMVHLFKLI